MTLLRLVLPISIALSMARGSALFTNLGPGDSSVTGYVGTQAGAGVDSTAIQFVATATGSLAQVLIPFGDTIGSANFGLYADNSGQPGALLEGWNDVTVPTVSTPVTAAFQPLTTIVSMLNPLLISGDTYWFEASVPLTAAGGFDWNESSVATGGIWAPLGGPGGPWTQFFATSGQAALELDSIPEPAAGALLGAGLLAMVVLGRRGKPEPTGRV